MSAEATARRTAILQKARAETTARKRQSVFDTLQRLADNGVQVTFELVARNAGVSRQFLYADSSLRAAVEQARQTAPAVPSPNTGSHDGDDLRTDLLLAREEIKRLRSENAKLKAKLVQHAASSQLTSDDEALRELTVRNAELAREATSLRRQLTAAHEDLAAARDTNRDLMTELNRRSRRE